MMGAHGWQPLLPPPPPPPPPRLASHTPHTHHTRTPALLARCNSYSWIILPSTLPPSFTRFLDKHGGKPLHM